MSWFQIMRLFFILERLTSVNRQTDESKYFGIGRDSHDRSGRSVLFLSD